MVLVLGTFRVPLQTHSPPFSTPPTLPSVSRKPLACSNHPLGFWLLTGLGQREPLVGEGRAMDSRPWAFISPAPFLLDLSS